VLPNLFYELFTHKQPAKDLKNGFPHLSGDQKSLTKVHNSLTC